MSEIEKKIQALEAEQAKIQVRQKKLAEQRQANHERLIQIEDEIHVLRIKELLNVPGGVVIRYRFSASDRCAKFNESKGTLIQVARTLGTVDFGDGEKWKWPLSRLLPATKADRQGYSCGG